MTVSVFRIATFIALSFFFLLQFFACSNNTPQTDIPSHYASLEDSVTYVGIETCAKCHSDKVESFSHTGMGLSFEHASKKKSSAQFGNHDIIHDGFKNLSYHPFWKGDSLMLLEFRIEKNDTVFKRLEKISWIVGSGQHTNSHLMNVNGYVYQAPATFYTQKKKWDLPPGFENGFNTRFGRVIGLECMTCHNAYPKMVMGSENKFDFVANGIDCERCHGPGSTHVKEKLSGHTVDVSKEIDYTIVNPSKLPIALQLDVCQRCHVQGNAVLNEGKSFFDFRPGMHLSDVMNIYMPKFKGEDDLHIMASHAERMKMSKCYLASVQNAEVKSKDHPVLKPYENAMTCVTCHDPHISVTSTGNSVFNGKCLSCHSTATSKEHDAVECKEKMEVRAKLNDNCVRCHMPQNNTIDIPHVITTDHWIRVPLNKNNIKQIKEFAGLACINNTRPGQKSIGEAYLSYFEKFSSNPAYLDSAKKYFSDVNADSIRMNFKNLIRLYFLKSDYKKIVRLVDNLTDALKMLNTQSYTNEHAWTAYRIGEAFVNEGNLERAIKFFSKSVELAPYQPDFRNKLANTQQDADQFEEARKNYEFIIKENPEYTSAYVSLGYLLLIKDHDPEAAGEMYDKALALDPDNIQAYFNKAGIMIYRGENNRAKDFLRGILRRDRSNEMARELLRRLSDGYE